MGKGFYKMEIDEQSFDKIFADLPKVAQRATANTVNIVARKINKNLKDHISTEYNVPKSAMKFGKLVSIKRANVRARFGNAVITIRRKGRDLIKYGAKQVESGISVAVRKSSTKIIKGGFVNPWHRGQSGDFAMQKAVGKRAGKTTRTTAKGTTYEADKRQTVYGPPISDLYTNEKAEKIIMRTIDTDFQPELDKQFGRQFEKGGR